MTLTQDLLNKMDTLGTRVGTVARDLRVLILARVTASEMAAAIAAAKAEILGGLPAAALDTITELATAVQGELSQTVLILQALGETVRFTPQTLTPAQQAIARANIGAAESTDLGESLLTNYNPIATFDAAYNA
jgi:uncharacterized protein (DUF2384 family)